MTKRQKKFILKELIPFILREHGRGFAMQTWREFHQPGSEVMFDGIKRRTPSCGTVACIGGSIVILRPGTELARHEIGLSRVQAENLFDDWNLFGWPARFRVRYAQARTPLAKAKVAVALLRKVVRTEGACLNDEEKESI